MVADNQTNIIYFLLAQKSNTNLFIVALTILDPLAAVRILTISRLDFSGYSCPVMDITYLQFGAKESLIR